MSGQASLNHVYRTIWNQALGAMVAVAEIASSAGRRSGGAARSTSARLVIDDAAQPLRAISLSILVALMVSPALAQTLPSGGVAVHGGAAFNTTQPNRLTVTTTNGAGSNHSAINWNSFSIGSGNTTNFVQPNAGSLSINRVVTNTPSQLFGTLSSNGKLVLVNQSGIAVGAGAVVDTAGFTASALAMSEADAVSGRLRFGGGSSANLTVDGNIIARGGDVVLIAPSVDVAKTALVESQGGSVVLAAGQSVEVTGRGLEGITLQVQAPTDQAINLGTLKGDAVGIFAGTLRHSGMIQAVQANMEGGKVVLRAVGDAYVEGQGQINATSAVGKGGSVDVLGNRVAIAGQSLIDVSGQQGGGNIRVGGDFQGKNAAVQNANMTYVGPDATLKADAVDSGNGGRVIVWADQQTQGYGTISARGGAQSGDGGFVEVSGKNKLAFDARVNTLAPHGKAGTLLLDPLDIDVINSGTVPLNQVDQFSDIPSTIAQVSPTLINAATTNVVLQATRDITFNSPVLMTNPGVGLSAEAGGIIAVQAPITTTGGNISLYANAPGSGGPGPGGSAVYVQAAISSNGGAISLRSDSSDVGGNSVVLAANVNAGAAGTITLTALNDRIQQTGGSLTGASLIANADYTISLNQPGNNIPGTVTLNSNTATSSGSSLDFSNSAPSFNLISATSKGNVSITTTGSVSTFGSPITSATGNISITAPTGMSLNSNITAAGSVSLTSNTSGNITQTGGFINAGGVTTASAAFGSVDLGQAGNDFNGIQVFGNGLTVRDANALNVGAFSNGTTGNISFTAGGVLTMPFGINIATTGDIALISGGSFTQQSTLSGANIALQSNGPMILSQNITASGTLTLNDIATGGGGINQLAGSIVAAGLTTVNTSSSGNVTLNQPGNDFGTITATGGAVSLADSNFLSLSGLVASGPAFVTAPLGISVTGNVNASSTLSLDTSAGNGGIVQSSGTIVAPGVATINAGTGNIFLTQTGNDFGTVSLAGGQVVVFDTINSMTVSSLTFSPTLEVYLQAAGNLSLPAGNIITTGPVTLISGTSLTTPGNIAGSNVFLEANGTLTLAHNVNATGTLDLINTGSFISDILQIAGAVTAIGGTNVSVSSAGTVTLNQPGNDFSTLQYFGGPLTLVDANAITLTSVAASGPVAVTAPAGITLAGNVTTSGTLNLDSSGANGNVIQNVGSGTITATGATTINAGTGNIFLGEITNNFSSISVIGGDLNVEDANALNVTSFTLTTPGGNVAFQARTGLTVPAGPITTTGDISLSDVNGPTLTTPGALSGRNVTLISGNGIVVANNITASGTLGLFTNGSTSSITQSTGTTILASGATTVQANAGGATVTLSEPGNDFSSISVAGGGAVSVRDANAIVLDNITASTLNLNTGGAITQSAGAGLTTTVQTTISAGTNNVTLQTVGNELTVLQVLNAGAVDVQNLFSPLTLFSSNAGSFKVTSNFDLLVTGTGVTATAGAVDIKSINGQITASSPIIAAGPITFEAATNLFANSLIQSSAPGDAIVLTSTSTSSTDIFSSTANSAMVTPNGRWLLNLNDPANAHVFQGSFVMTPTDFIVYDALVTPVPNSGNGRLFTVPAPSLSAGLSGSVTKVFDGNTNISLVGSSLSGIGGYLPGDVGGTPSGGVGTLASPNVGTNIPVTATGITIAGVTNSNCGGCTVYGYQFGSATGNIGNVTPAVVGISPISLSGIRAYDGTVIVNANIFSLSGLQGSDTLTLAGSGSIADKNVGVNKPVSLGSLVLGNGTGLASNYTFTGGNFVATITPAPITGVVGVTADNKVYDGSTTATLQTSGATLSGLLGIDKVSISGLTGAFADRNVGTGKVVSITGATLSGADAGNYSLAGGVPAARADITVRALSVWTGAAGGLWSSSGNWDALPDGNNVLAVSIPAGAGAVTFDAGVANTNLQSLNSQRPVVISGGALAVGSDLSLTSLGQTGGALTGSGGLNVNGNFNQTGGSMVFGRAVSVTQVAGSLVVGDLTAPAISLTAPAGGISQTAALATPSLVLSSASGTVLTQSGNRIGSVKATNTGNGDIELINTGSLDVAGVRNDDGDITITNRGAVSTSDLVDAPKGVISITANSPLTIGLPGIAAGGDVNLTATNQTSPGNLRIDGPITSGGAVTMTAGNNLTQNSAIVAVNGVTATANGAISYGSGAFSSRAPVLYNQNGVRITPPPSPEQARSEATNAAPDAVVAFLESFERTQQRLVDDALSINPDGSPVKRRDPNAVVTEGNVCVR
jgi:filamentous hemagglutinin family protein